MKSDNQGRYYNSKFYRELASAQDSAREVLPIIFEVMRPVSMIDIGCGTGHWLSISKELGVKETLGVDGRWAKSQLLIAQDNFIEHDLAVPLTLQRRFDLALSLEVAEHLPQSAARIFVQTLCNAADTVIFSAAIPGQGGRHHVNEQWPAYWADLFRERGYQCYDYLRPKIWNNTRVAWYYAQNCLIFVRSGAQHAFGEAVIPLPLVHPALWAAEVERMKRPGKLLERFLRTLFKSS